MKKRNLIIWYVLFITLTGIHVQAKSTDSLSTINLNSDRELFIDHFLIDQLIGTQLIMHQPKDEGPVLQFDKHYSVFIDGNEVNDYYLTREIAEQHKEEWEAE